MIAPRVKAQNESLNVALRLLTAEGKTDMLEEGSPAGLLTTSAALSALAESPRVSRGRRGVRVDHASALKPRTESHSVGGSVAGSLALVISWTIFTNGKKPAGVHRQARFF